MHIVSNKLVGGYVSEVAAEGGSTIIVIEDSDTTANRKFQNYRYIQSKGLTELGIAVHPYGGVIIPDSVKERATNGEIDLSKYHVEVSFNRVLYVIALNALMELGIGEGIEFTKAGAGYSDGEVLTVIPPIYVGYADKYLKVKHSGIGLEWADIPTELPDQTSASAGDVLTIGNDGLEWAGVPEELPAIGDSDAGKVLTVNSGHNGTEWANVPNELPAIGDTDAGKVLTVNSGHNGTEWANIPSELPAISAGDGGKVLKVNSGETGVEWGTGGGGNALYCHYIRLTVNSRPLYFQIINNSAEKFTKDALITYLYNGGNFKQIILPATGHYIITNGVECYDNIQGNSATDFNAYGWFYDTSANTVTAKTQNAYSNNINAIADNVVAL